MPKIWITCTQRVTYSQQVLVSEEELAQLREVEGNSVSDTGSEAEIAAYRLLEDRLDPLDIYIAEEEYDDISLEPR